MSAFDAVDGARQKRTWATAPQMSAVGGKADIGRTRIDMQCSRCNGYGHPRIIALARHPSVLQKSAPSRTGGCEAAVIRSFHGTEEQLLLFRLTIWPRHRVAGAFRFADFRAAVALQRHASPPTVQAKAPAW